MKQTAVVQRPNSLVGLLESALRWGGTALSDVPDLLRQVLKSGIWQEFTDSFHTIHRHERFIDFIVAKPPAGLGSDERMLRHLVRDDKKVSDALDLALQGKRTGRPKAGQKVLYNIQDISAPTGTSEAAALRRLRRQFPELHKKVLAGELSAHRAAVQAGFRPATITVRIDDAGRAVSALLKHFSVVELSKALEKAK